MAELVNLVEVGGTPWSRSHDPEDNMGTIDTAITGLANVVNGTTSITGAVTNTANVGAAGTDVTAVESGDGTHHVTTLTVAGLDFAVAGAADEAIGKLIYTFPAGVHLHKVTYMSIALQGTGTIDADTPDIGVGSAEATGVVAVLGGTATFEDYLTGQTAGDCSGTATVATTVATAGALTGISVNAVGDDKTVYLNIADGWAGADTATASGTVVLEWTTLV